MSKNMVLRITRGMFSVTMVAAHGPIIERPRAGRSRREKKEDVNKAIHPIPSKRQSEEPTWERYCKAHFNVRGGDNDGSARKYMLAGLVDMHLSALAATPPTAGLVDMVSVKSRKFIHSRIKAIPSKAAASSADQEAMQASTDAHVESDERPEPGSLRARQLCSVRSGANHARQREGGSALTECQGSRPRAGTGRPREGSVHGSWMAERTGPTGRGPRRACKSQSHSCLHSRLGWDPTLPSRRRRRRRKEKGGGGGERKKEEEEEKKKKHPPMMSL